MAYIIDTTICKRARSRRWQRLTCNEWPNDDILRKWATGCASGLLGGLSVGDVMLGLRFGGEVRRCERDSGETRLGAALVVEPGFEDVNEVAAVDDGEGGIDDNEEVIDAPDVDGIAAKSKLKLRANAARWSMKSKRAAHPVATGSPRLHGCN